jgi:hypothetical protein
LRKEMPLKRFMRMKTRVNEGICMDFCAGILCPPCLEIEPREERGEGVGLRRREGETMTDFVGRAGGGGAALVEQELAGGEAGEMGPDC